MIGTAALAAVKPEAVIVNPAHGPVIDEAALPCSGEHWRWPGTWTCWARGEPLNNPVVEE